VNWKKDFIFTLFLDLASLGVIAFGTSWALKIEDNGISHWFVPICWVLVIGNLVFDSYVYGRKFKRK
jgi:hypothetical protein